MLQFKIPYRDGGQPYVAAGVHAAAGRTRPPSRLHLIRFHGVLAPHAK